MKKHGKFEKRAAPRAVSAGSAERETSRKKELRSALLQTYFTSLLCLVLCVSMFFGTSYAWFTSEVNNTTNQIYVGQLDVGLYKEDGDKLLDLSNSAYQLFDNGIRWDPGYTMLETIQIKNDGELAFKYVMTFTDGNLGNARTQSLDTVAGCFDVWVHDHKGGKPTPVTYADISPSKGWEHIGNLAEVLAGKTVLTGNMNAKFAHAESNDTHKYTIAVHMNEGAGSNVMGHTLRLNVKLVAYQQVTGTDGLGDREGEIVPVSNLEDLKTETQAGKTVMMTGDVKIASVDDRITMNGGILDGAGNTITYSGGRVNDGSVGIVTTTGGTVSNLVIDGGSNGRALYVTDLKSDLTVSGCTLGGAYGFNLNSAQKTEYTIRFTNCHLKNWTSYANVVESVNFTGCEIGGNLKPYATTVLRNCIFSTTNDGTLDVSALESGETVTLVNCTYKGKTIEKAVLTSDGGRITVTGTKLIAVNDENMVVLANNG